MNTFFIADTHFDEDHIRIYENRPFASVNEMNEAFISNWNKVVKPDDVVYHLGDVGNAEFISSLNGIKYLVKGNHDTFDNGYYRNAGFKEVYDLPVIFGGFWMLSHEPLYVNTNMPYANIYGHVHGNPNYKDSSSHGFCASAERIDYTPITIEDIKKRLK